MFEPIDTIIDGRYILRPPPHVPRSRNRTIVLGVDCGQIRDYSALCAVEYHDALLSPGDPMAGEAPVFETHYRVLGAQRLELGTSYPDVARRINTMAKRLYDRDRRGEYHVVMDATGVGVPVVDMVRASIIPQVHVTAVMITGSAKGDDSLLWRERASVGKVWLVSRLQAILQSQRLAAPRDPLLAAMIEELKIFEIRRTPTGHEETGAFAVGTHDDLAVALALACTGEHVHVRYGPEVNSLPSPPL